MRPLASILSVLLHPLWMPTAAIVLCSAIDPFLGYGFDKEGLLIVYGIVFTMTALFPLSSAFLMRRTGLVSDVTMPLRQERLPAFSITLLYYGMCYYLLHNMALPPMILGVFFGATAALAAVTLITIWWKISAHMAGIGGVVGAVLAVMIMDDAGGPFVLCALFVLAGALGTARLVASNHTPAQIYTGAVLGCACVFGCAVGGVVM